jgi:hypothetical protein
MEDGAALRYKSLRMVVRTKRAYCAKPGGTAGDYLLLSQHLLGQERFFVPRKGKELCQNKKFRIRFTFVRIKCRKHGTMSGQI